MFSISMLIASIVLGGAMMVNNSFQGPGGARPKPKPVQEEIKPEDNGEVGAVPAPGQDGK